MNLRASSTSLVFLGLTALFVLAGCGDDESATTSGAGGGDATTATGTGGAGGGELNLTPVGMAQVFVVNRSDETLTLDDPFGDTGWVVEPRYGKWADFPVYGPEGGCLGGESCVVFERKVTDGGTRVVLDAADGDELVHVFDSSITFAASDVGEPGAGNAAIQYSGMTGFGYVDGDELVSLSGLDEVPADAPVGYSDGEGGYTLVQDGGLPFIDGNRYYVDGDRTDPPSLLVCDISHDSPPFGCFDYLLED